MKLTVKQISREGYKKSSVFHEELALLKAQELICDLMKEKSISKSSLAKLLGQSKSHVTELLSGSRNLTLRTFGRICFHLGHQVDFSCTESLDHKYKDVRVNNSSRIIRGSAGYSGVTRKIQSNYFVDSKLIDAERVIAPMKYGL